MPAELSRSEQSLLAFYRGEGSTPRGFTFATILAWADDVWEQVHDFIQWVFPNDARSAYNPSAPLLTPELIRIWPTDPVLQSNLGAAFERWLRFAGVDRTGTGGFRFGHSPNRDVWVGPNHNWLRITRVLKCLRLLGRADEARSLLAFFEGDAATRFHIDAGTLGYWRAAVE